MKKIVFTLLLSLLLPLVAVFGSESDSLQRYYFNVFTGERKTSNYFGPIDPRATFNDENGDLWTLDDQFKASYLNHQVQAEAVDLNNFWFKKVVDKSNCPDLNLGENIDYIRYLYRLVTISYLFEEIKLNYKAAKEI